MKKRVRGITVILAIATVILTGCGAAYKDSASTTEAAYESYDAGGGYYAAADNAAAVEYEYMEDSVAESEEGYEAKSDSEVLDENAQMVERKLIKTVSLDVETEDYDVLLSNLEKRITDLGGYIEYQYQYNGSKYSNYQNTRNAQLDIRIPAERLDEFVVTVGEQSNITNKVEQVEDVTLQYVDLESRKKTLVTEQDRLLELLTKAESVEDIIAIEQRLSEVRYELESMESQLRALLNQVDYSTVHLNINEVRQYTPTEEKSLLDKMKNGFVRSVYRIGDDIEDGFIWFVSNIPYFIIWGVIIVVVIVLFKRHRRRKKAKTEAMQTYTSQDVWDKEAAEENKTETEDKD